MDKKDIKYYTNLTYGIIIRELRDDDGTVFMALTKELNPDAFYGTGDTPAEAIEDFNSTREELFEYYLQNGLPIPEPEPKSNLN